MSMFDREKKDLLYKCNLILDFFNNYFTEDELGKIVYESAKLQYNSKYNDSLTAKKLILTAIIKYYYKDNKESKHLKDAMLNYFMIQYTKKYERYIGAMYHYYQEMYNCMQKYYKDCVNNNYALYIDYNESSTAIYNKVQNAIVDGKLLAKKYFKIVGDKNSLYYIYDKKRGVWEEVSILIYYLDRNRKDY